MAVAQKRSVWVARLAGALGLVALSWMAVPSTRAQDAVPDPAEEACFIYAGLIGGGVDFCFEEGCEPTEKDCDKLCKTAGQTCSAVTKALAKTVSAAARGQQKGARVLCKTALDPKGCKQGVKDDHKSNQMAVHDFTKGAKQACTDASLVSDCVEACTMGFSCFCEGADLICGL